MISQLGVALLLGTEGLLNSSPMSLLMIAISHLSVLFTIESIFSLKTSGVLRRHFPQKVAYLKSGYICIVGHGRDLLCDKVQSAQGPSGQQHFARGLWNTSFQQVCPECDGALHVMGHETRREIVIIPAQVKIVEHVRNQNVL